MVDEVALTNNERVGTDIAPRDGDFTARSSLERLGNGEPDITSRRRNASYRLAVYEYRLNERRPRLHTLDLSDKGYGGIPET